VFGQARRQSILPEPTVIARDVHPYFYAEMDENNVYHVLYQDNTGNINYIYMDGQWSRVIPVLGSKTPSAYNKQLYIAPLKNNIYLFMCCSTITPSCLHIRQLQKAGSVRRK
jgi:hypothetical protein